MPYYRNYRGRRKNLAALRYKKLYRRRKRRKRYRKRMTRIGVMSIKNPSTLPDSTRVKLVYNEVITMTNVSGVGNYIFRLNSLFDPNFTGVGHQCLGYDQWIQFYNSYEVHASSIKIRCIAKDTNPVQLVCYPAIDSTPLSQLSTAREQPYAKHTWVTSTTASVFNGIKNYISVKKLEGRQVLSNNYIATTSSNPANTRYWVLKCESQNQTDISDIYFDIRITYYCRLFRRLTLTGS